MHYECARWWVCRINVARLSPLARNDYPVLPRFSGTFPPQFEVPVCLEIVHIFVNILGRMDWYPRWVDLTSAVLADYKFLL